MISLLLILSLSCLTGYVAADPDYLDALTKSILFYEGQRSGKVDLSVLRDKWRGDSALQDGIAEGVRLLTCPSHVSGPFLRLYFFRFPQIRTILYHSRSPPRLAHRHPFLVPG